MESWNETCMATGLPILYGEPCMAVFLLESPYYNSKCHASNAYVPFFLIDGAYDGYGSLFSNEDTEEGERLLKEVFQSLYIGKKDWLKKVMVHGGFVESGTSISEKKSLMLRTVFISQGLCRQVKKLGYTDSEGIGIAIERLQKDCRMWNAGQSSELERNIAKGLSELMQSLSESAPNGAVWNAMKILFKSSPDRMAEKAKMLVGLTKFLGALRMAWHIPSGTGSQEIWEPEQEVFLKFYEERLGRLKEGIWD